MRPPGATPRAGGPLILCSPRVARGRLSGAGADPRPARTTAGDALTLAQVLSFSVPVSSSVKHEHSSSHTVNAFLPGKYLLARR